jgi:hypothetical protein
VENIDEVFAAAIPELAESRRLTMV